MNLMDLIGYAIGLLLLITMPPVSIIIILVCKIYRHLKSHLPPHVMTKEEEARLRQIIEDIRNGNE